VSTPASYRQAGGTNGRNSSPLRWIGCIKKTVVACVITPNPKEGGARRFKPYNDDWGVVEAVDWLISKACTHVAMEREYGADFQHSRIQL